MKRSWLFHISPCLLAAVFCVFAIIIIATKSSVGLSLMMGIIFLPVLSALLLADFLIKALTKGKVLYIWIIEAIVVAIFVIGGNNYFR